MKVTIEAYLVNYPAVRVSTTFYATITTCEVQSLSSVAILD